MGSFLVLVIRLLRATVFSRAILARLILHGTAADLINLLVKAGRGCCRVQQFGAFQGI